MPARRASAVLISNSGPRLMAKTPFDDNHRLAVDRRQWRPESLVTKTASLDALEEDSPSEHSATIVDLDEGLAGFVPRLFFSIRQASTLNCFIFFLCS